MDLSVHRRTPSVSVNDGRGLPVRQIAYLRNVPGAAVQSLITRQRHDAAGRAIEHWDPRLFATAPKANLTTIHDMAGQSLQLNSVDSGWSLGLHGLAGEVVRRWDARGNRWSNRYDNRLRLQGIKVNDGPEMETMRYGAADADAEKNLRGQLLHKVDASGSLDYSSFSLNALPLEETRTLRDAGVYTTRWRYGANGAALSQTDASGHQQCSRYDVGGQLQQVTLKISGDDAVKDILKHAQYNAEGEKIEQTLGNGVVCNWEYDGANGRLNGIKAGLPGQALRQNLEYQYDKVGNVVGLLDRTVDPVFFANQLIDGQRDFSYDSLYRLIRATGQDVMPPTGMPGRALPSDPKNRLNYTQTYEYDTGGNLIKLVHARAIAGYTHHMFIDPNSNRGVRWKEGDPPPDFSTQFDAHGNLQALQPGQGLQWNVLDELASVTLIERESALPDKETYRYSGGARVFKHHQTQGSITTHFHQVRYLPGIEIRTRETGEELHVITLPSLIGNVRCLHWLSGRPGEINNNQLRYCLEDSQSSTLIELDQNARLISHEHYYPFGGTASLVANSRTEVSYKTIRYSGKELDDTGLYYYGRRYYAPWLQRWISADPAGAVDGWNLYAMVGNNPTSFVDEFGLNDKLNERVSSRTTSMISAGNEPVDSRPAKQKRRLLENPDRRFTKKYRNTQAVAHAGVLIPGTSSDQDIIVTDFFNISLERAEFTEKEHGFHITRQSDNNLDSSELASLGVFQVDDLNEFASFMAKLYINRLADKDLAVKIYNGESSEPQSLKGMEYEVPLLHDVTLDRMKRHIEASNNRIPMSRGLPGAHAEVQAANAALYIQQHLTGSTNPKEISIVTQKLQQADYAQAFEACYNCTGQLVATYDNAVVPFDVLSGATNQDHEHWINQQKTLSGWK
ncbi:RHS repeat-associated core domain-containing protein [Pseudomonas fluorescens]|uniref:RHS repeat-associated core domain-containing protein n=2 Tax=Pseudomonas TaxID=286 RepID=UPI0030DC5717